MTLYRRARSSRWLMAECLIALRRPPREDASEEEEMQAMVGALLVADGMVDLKRLAMFADALASTK